MGILLDQRIYLLPQVELFVVYAVMVLGFVATSPDIGLRCLIADDDNQSHGVGVTIWESPESTSNLVPNPGDVLARLNREPTRTFLDFVHGLQELRDASGDTLLAVTITV